MAGRKAIVTVPAGDGAFIAEPFAAEGAAVAVTARTVDSSTTPLEGTITTPSIGLPGRQPALHAADLAKREDESGWSARLRPPWVESTSWSTTAP